MKLGGGWLRTHLAATKMLARPFTFLIHLTDIADFTNSQTPFFRNTRYFAGNAKAKLEFLEQSLTHLNKSYGEITLTEDVFDRLQPDVLP